MIEGLKQGSSFNVFTKVQLELSFKSLAFVYHGVVIRWTDRLGIRIERPAFGTFRCL
jgi:hypothetical protein